MARVPGSWLVFGLLLGMSSVWANPVLVAAEDDWAPYCALDKESGQPQGLAPALVKAMSQLRVAWGAPAPHANTL